MADKKLDFKSARIALTVSRSALTKAEKEFEINCKDIQKNSDASQTKKVRLMSWIIRALKTSYEAEVTLAETLLSPVESQPATAVLQTAAGEMFKPQSNLKPSYLDKNSTHLEVKNFCQNVETYIVTGFKD